MKNYAIYPIICLCLCWLLPACSDNGEEFSDYLTPAPESQTAFSQGLSFTDAALTQSITFEAGNTWKATLEGENASAWCRVNPTQGNAGKSTKAVVRHWLSVQAQSTSKYPLPKRPNLM